MLLFKILLEPKNIFEGDCPSFFTSLVLFAEGSEQTPLLKICQKAGEYVWPSGWGMIFPSSGSVGKIDDHC